MADPIFTLTRTKKIQLPGLVVVVGTFGSDGGTYIAGGHPVTPLLSQSDPGLLREPDFVLFQSYNGYTYDYDPTTKKIMIRVATTAGTNAIEAQHTAAAVVAAARTGVNFIAFWVSGVGE